MTRPASNSLQGGRTGHETGPAPVAGSQLAGVGIGLRYVAAVCGVSAGCEVQIGVGSLALSGVDGSRIRVVEARLGLQDPDDASFLAAVLRLPPVARTSAADDWRWRGWLVGARPHTPLLSVTLSSASGGAATQGGAWQSRVPGQA